MITLKKCSKCGGMNLSTAKMCGFCLAFMDEQSEKTFLDEYKEKQQENIEKAKIILGEEYVKRSLEENPDASHSFHLSEPYNSISLDELKRMKRLGLL